MSGKRKEREERSSKRSKYWYFGKTKTRSSSFENTTLHNFENGPPLSKRDILLFSSQLGLLENHTSPLATIK